MIEKIKQRISYQLDLERRRLKRDGTVTEYLYKRIYGGTARRLAWWTLRRDATNHGRNVAGWHATNIVLHAACGMLVFAILRCFYSGTAAALGAAVFASHPAATSSVANISGRFGLLCAAFYFAALLCAIIGGWFWFLVPALAYGAWSSKEESVMLPFAILATLIIIRIQ